MNKHIFIIVIFFLISSQQIFPQQSGKEYRRFGIMDGNNIKTVFGNWGVIGQPGDNGSRGAWLFPSNGYIGDETVLLGLELPIKDYNNDGKLDSIHSVITCPTSRPTQLRDEDPNTGKQWAFEPVSGFLNSSVDTVAMSNDPSSWPTLWNGQWNGLLGMGKTVATLETYFQMDDQNDERFNISTNNVFGVAYHPDTTNVSRKGHGIRVDVRYLQFNHPLFRDVMFKVYDIKNESSFKYNKVVFGDLVGTYIGVTGNDGGPQEYNDDYTIFYKKENVIVSGDFKHGGPSRNPLWRGPVGMFGSAFVGAPNNDSIASFDYFSPANNFKMGDDESLWGKLKPGHFIHPDNIINDTAVAGSDGDYIFGSNYFSLESGETKQIVSVMSYGYTPKEIFQKVKMAKVLYNNNFDTSKIGTHIQLTNLTSHTTVSENFQISWSSEKIVSSVDIDFSPDAGTTWLPIVSDISNNLSYVWNTTAIADCPFGFIRIFMKDAQGKLIDFSQSGYITVDNSGNGAPFIAVRGDMFSSGNTLTQKTVDVEMLVGDPDNSILSLQTLYDAGNGYQLSASQTINSDTSSQPVKINLETLPNSNSISLKFVLSDGGLTYTITTLKFSKQTPRSVLQNINALFTNQNLSDPSSISVNVFDRKKVTNDTYVISFCDTIEDLSYSYGTKQKRTFTVFNKTKGIYTLQNVPLSPFTESPAFDGLTLFSNGAITKVNKIIWNDSTLSKYQVSLYAESIFAGEVPLYANPVDYKMIFYNYVVDTSLLHPKYPDILGAHPIKFKLINEKTNTAVKSYFFSSTENSLYGSTVIAVENILGKERPTWEIYFSGDPFEPAKDIQGGDTLFISTIKGVSYYDTITVSNVALEVENNHSSIPGSFELFQNYPNPFNPVTTIKYQLPEAVLVTVKVYDVIGREVAALVNEVQDAGNYSAQLNASKLSRQNAGGLASGIYFYTLRAGNFVSTKKMVLIK
ncbi:MAG: T9SS type A sorting domain-containing protein [Bacteroidota bacterium]|nr:T9SS type A sorting domain-containing protein [Bacteroidota bacterium]